MKCTTNILVQVLILTLLALLYETLLWQREYDFWGVELFVKVSVFLLVFSIFHVFDIGLSKATVDTLRATFVSFTRNFAPTLTFLIIVFLVGSMIVGEHSYEYAPEILTNPNNLFGHLPLTQGGTFVFAHFSIMILFSRLGTFDILKLSKRYLWPTKISRQSLRESCSLVIISAAMIVGVYIPIASLILLPLYFNFSNILLEKPIKALP